MKHQLPLLAVWLIAIIAVVSYLKHHGVSMGLKVRIPFKKDRVSVDNTPNGKLNKAADSIIKAVALLKAAKHLATEAGVPRLVEHIGHAETLASQAAHLADAVRFNASSDDYLPATKSEPSSLSDRDTVKSAYSWRDPPVGENKS